MVSAAETAATITVRFRTAPNVEVSSVALADADPNELADTHPWREFHWHAGQKHYLGATGQQPCLHTSSTNRAWS